MTEVERAEVILNDAEKHVANARKALREARITEAAGGRKPVPVDLGFWAFLKFAAHWPIK